MESIMTVRAPADLQNILSLQARNALILQILWDWTERQGSPSINRHSDEGREGVGVYQHEG